MRVIPPYIYPHLRRTLLLDDGVPPDIKRCITYNEFKHRVTHKCPCSEYNAAILLLLEAGVDLNVAKPRKSQWCFPETAMDIAFMYADPDVAHTLRAAGAKYGYELCDNAEREKEEEWRSTVKPIALPEPEEWFIAAGVRVHPPRNLILFRIFPYE